MNEISKKIQVLKLSLSVIGSVDDLLRLTSKNLNELRGLYLDNKPSFSDADISFLQSMSALERNLTHLNRFISERKDLKDKAQASTLIQKLKLITDVFNGYEVGKVVEDEIQKITNLIPTLRAPVLKQSTSKRVSHFPAYTNINRKPITNPPPKYAPYPTSTPINSLPSTVETLEPGAHICIDCGKSIPKARIELMPHVLRCVNCQSEFEMTHDTRIKVDEGFGGSRDDVRKMKSKQWGEMVNRGIINTGKPKRGK